MPRSVALQDASADMADSNCRRCGPGRKMPGSSRVPIDRVPLPPVKRRSTVRSGTSDAAKISVCRCQANSPGVPRACVDGEVAVVGGAVSTRA